MRSLLINNMDLEIGRSIEGQKRKVWVEIGPGHRPGGSIIDRLRDTKALLNGSVAYVAIDEEKDNLSFPKVGSVANFELHDFAESSFLDESVEKMFLFNVFGEPTSSASKPDFVNVFKGLARKLEKGGTITIAEHITPEFARFLLDEFNLAKLRALGLDPFPYKNIEECEGVLTSLGFKKEFVYEFMRMHEAHGKYKGPDKMPFVLILEKI